MNEFETTLLTEWKVKFPNINWPEALKESCSLSDYSDSFQSQLKLTFRQLLDRQAALDFYETALVIFYRRLTTQFKPEIIQKKTKLKTPKVGSIAEVECTSCANPTGVWSVKKEYPIITEIHLVCPMCEFVMSEVVQIPTKVKVTRVKAEKPEGSIKVSKLKVVTNKKPSKGDMEAYTYMHNMITTVGQALETFPEEYQALYLKVKAYQENKDAPSTE